jgi:hypothetical protein
MKARSKVIVIGVSGLVFPAAGYAATTNSRRGADNPVFAPSKVILLDRLGTPEAELARPAPEYVADALRNRPEIGQSRVNLESAASACWAPRLRFARRCTRL